MSPRLTMNVMLALSVCYGAAVFLLGLVDSSAVATVAIVGAVILGALWTLRALLNGRSPEVGK